MRTILVILTITFSSIIIATIILPIMTKHKEPQIDLATLMEIRNELNKGGSFMLPRKAFIEIKVIEVKLCTMKGCIILEVPSIYIIYRAEWGFEKPCNYTGLWQLWGNGTHIGLCSGVTVTMDNSGLTIGYYNATPGEYNKIAIYKVESRYLASLNNGYIEVNGSKVAFFQGYREIKLSEKKLSS